MSEPMSSVEIEDVLSSIRRLVSEDLRPGAKKPDASAAPAAPPSDKLILTPALRIAPEEDAATPDTPAEPSASFQSVRSTAAPSPVDAVMTEVGRSADIRPDDWEPADGEEVAGFAKDWPGDWPEDDASTANPTPAEVEADGADWESVDPAAADFGDMAETGADAAAPDVMQEVAVADQGDARDPDSADWIQDPVADAEIDDSFAAERPRAAHTDVVEDPDWADAAEAEVRAALEEETAETVFAHFDDPVSHDERPFDEEMLRDLVRDIIREELQGALGERITRNVRKLVRAEIARALAVRDFE
ncbi:MAG: hypothetical protein RLZZ563_441 [Pseudomonadota bacterium]